MRTQSNIQQLLAEARYRRRRCELSWTKMYGPRPTTMTRLSEVERAYRGALARLRRAQQRPGPRRRG